MARFKCSGFCYKLFWEWLLCNYGLLFIDVFGISTIGLFNWIWKLVGHKFSFLSESFILKFDFLLSFLSVVLYFDPKSIKFCLELSYEYRREFACGVFCNFLIIISSMVLLISSKKLVFFNFYYDLKFCCFGNLYIWPKSEIIVFEKSFLDLTASLFSGNYSKFKTAVVLSYFHSNIG